MIDLGGNGRFPQPDGGQRYDDPGRDFPLRDEYTDCSERKRIFEITHEEVALGHRVVAQEVGKDGMGYEFAAFDPTGPYLALGEVRDKIYRALATRYVVRKGQPHHVPTHDVVRGRITGRDGEAVFVVDGEPLSLAEFGLLVGVHEGWEFELRFIDPS